MYLWSDERMDEESKQILKLKIALIKHMEPMVDRNENHSIKVTYVVQYLTQDNYVLSAHPASEFERELFDKFSKSP